ncbi:MAG: hypothetical protein RIR26_502, partial [Pseudomonadota bacterium]
MTMGRKTFTRLKICRAFKRSCLVFCNLSILFAALGCQTTPLPAKQTVEIRSTSEIDELRTAVNASRALECKLMGNEWYIPGDVQHAKLVRNKNNLALVYQALLRTGPRTVYQSLTRGLAFEGDGVVVGLKNLPNVTDYETYQNASGDVMTVSRTKAPNSELFKAMVEINVEGDTWWRPILPTDANETVQQIWPVLPMGN